MSGRIAGKRLEIASLIGLDTEHEGFGIEVDLNGLRLTGKAARPSRNWNRSTCRWASGAERWSAPGENYFLFPVEPTAVTPDASAGVIAAPGNDGTTMQIYMPPPRDMLLRGPRIDLASRELSATISSLSADDPVTATIATLDYGDAKIQIRPSVGAFELIGIRAIATQFIADRSTSGSPPTSSRPAKRWPG